MIKKTGLTKLQAMHVTENENGLRETEVRKTPKNRYLLAGEKPPFGFIPTQK